jgi:hypothetical protein
MEKEKLLRLLIRQLKDIQTQAEKIITGDNSEESIENFSRYSHELKEFIVNNVDSIEILKYIEELPEIDFSRSKIKLWQYLILPSWWMTLYKDYHQKNKMIEQIGEVRGKYATLELLVRGYQA